MTIRSESEELLQILQYMSLVTCPSFSVLILQRSFSLTGPHVFLTVFRSNILSAFVSSLVTVQVPDAYFSTGRTAVSYSFNLVFRDRSLDWRSGMCATYVLCVGVCV